MLELVLDEGRVRKARLKDRFDYEALLLNIDEVKSLMQDEDHGGVPIYKVPTLIGVGDRVTGRLIENGILPVRIARNATNRGMQRIVDRPAIDQFRRTFVSLSDLAKERSVDRQVVRREIAAHGARPAFDAGQIGAFIYRRCDLP